MCLVCKSCQKKSTYQDFRFFFLIFFSSACFSKTFMCASKEDFHRKRMQSEGMYLLLLLFMTLDVCQLLDDSVLNGRYELFTN